MRHYPEGVSGCLVRLTSWDLQEAVRVAGDHRDCARVSSASTLTQIGACHVQLNGPLQLHVLGECSSSITTRNLQLCLYWVECTLYEVNGLGQNRSF